MPTHPAASQDPPVPVQWLGRRRGCRGVRAIDRPRAARNSDAPNRRALRPGRGARESTRSPPVPGHNPSRTRARRCKHTVVAGQVRAASASERPVRSAIRCTSRLSPDKPCARNGSETMFPGYLDYPGFPARHLFAVSRFPGPAPFGKWRARRDSNSRPSGSKPDALSN